jgi:hypothetical protein
VTGVCNVPQCATHYSAWGSKFVYLSIRQTIPVRDALKCKFIRHRYVREIPFQQVIRTYINSLYPPPPQKKFSHQHMKKPQKTGTCLLNLNLAPFDAATSTARGLQLNLYRSGPKGTSGAGRPPQNDVKETMSLFSERILLTREMAEQWSIPGSSPISSRRRTPAARALLYAEKLRKILG